MIKKFQEFNEEYIIQDILGGVNEGNYDILDKVKKYAKVGALTAAILASVLSNKSFSQDQKDQIKSAANISSVKKSVTITPEMRVEWNKFVDWMAKEYPNVSDKGPDPTAKIVSDYRKVNSKTCITKDNIIDFQIDLANYNEKWKALQPNYHEKGIYIKKASPTDNRIGSITSKFIFPDIKFEYKGKMVDFGTDIDRAIDADIENKLESPYIDPDLTPQQRFQQNQERAAKGLKPMTVAEHDMLTKKKLDKKDLGAAD